MLQKLLNLMQNDSNAGNTIVQHESPTLPKKTDKNVLKRKITWLLTKFEHFRDDDCELINAIWYDELSDYGPTDRLSIDFFFSYHHHLTSADTICRYRRRIQQLNPELRGKYYKQRRSKQDEWKQELGYNEPTP